MRAFLPVVLLVLLSSLLTAQERPAAGARPVSAPASAAAPVGTGAIRIGKEGFVLPASEFGMLELITAAATYLQRNILWNPTELQQVGGANSFVFQKELALDAPGCEEVLCQLLYMKGFALLTVDADKGIYEVVFMGGPRGREVPNSAQRRTPEEILRRPHLKQYVLTEVKLEHINANVATNSLRPFFGQGGMPNQGIGVTFGTAGSNSAVLISGFQDQVAQMILLLDSCDVPGPDVPADAIERIARLERTVQQLQQQLGEAKPASK